MKIKALQPNSKQYKLLLDCIADLMRDLVKNDESLHQATGLIDFEKYLFVLPTREAARLFREKVTEIFMVDGGVLSLRTVQPEYFLYGVPEGKANLSSVKALELWNQVLEQSINVSDEYLFKNQVWQNNINNPAWRIGVCKTFQNLRKDIALETGLSVQDFLQEIKTLQKNSFEYDNALNNLAGKLEEYIKYETEFIKLKGDMYCDETDLILANIKKASVSDSDIKKIILLDCCELKKSVLKVFDNLQQSLDIELYLNVSPEELDLFDKNGHVKLDEIKKINIDIDFSKQLAEYDKPIDMAKKIFSVVTQNIHNQPRTIGVLSNEVVEYLEFLAEDFNLNNDSNPVSFHCPQGDKLIKYPWTQLFLKIISLANSELTFEDIAFLVRNGLVTNFLTQKIKSLNYKLLLQTLDELQKSHLLNSLDMLEFFVNEELNNGDDIYQKIKEIISIIRDWQNRLLNCNDLILTAWNIVTEIGKLNDLENLNYEQSVLELEELKKIIYEISLLSCDKDLKQVIFHSILKDKQLEFKSDNDESIDLSGFLELSWCSNKQLLIAGMNEENFNCAESTDMFIPENLRELLHFTSQKDRHATDIYRFSALNKAHDLGLMISNSNNAGDILKPARLLFYIANDKLAEYCQMLFSGSLYEDMREEKKSDAKYFPYQVVIAGDKKKTISVSDINSYLKCPYNFYLQSIKLVSDIDDRNIEFGGDQIGSIIHEVLEQFGRIGDLKSLTYEDMKNYFYDTLHTLIARKYLGKSYNGLVDIQLENLKKMLRNIAARQFEYMQDKENFVVLATEQSFKVNLSDFFGSSNDKLNDIVFKGKIDRIDSFYENGKRIIQIFDYKTSKKVVAPFDAHISDKCNKLIDSQKWQICKVTEDMHGCGLLLKKDIYSFSNVQLPLYMAIVKRNLLPDFDFSNCEVRVAYFNLSVNYDDTRIEVFDNCQLFVPDAEKILQEATEKIFFERQFWPPSFNANYGVLEKLNSMSFEDWELQEEK